MFSQEQLLNILQRGETRNFMQLARALKVPRKDNRDFSKWLFNLVKQGIIFQSPSRDYFLPKFEKTISGIIRINARAFGFVDIADESSIFVAPNNINSAMDGDEVELNIFEDPTKKGFYQGVVEKITKRARLTFVGRIKQFGKRYGIIPLDEKIHGRFVFESIENLQEDYEVKVKIVKHGNPSVIKVIKILGHMDEVSIDILSIIEDANVPYVFDPATILEAKKIPDEVEAQDLANRHDLRERLIVTIDGDDTKDFDDAIEVKKLANGNYYLGVHIADVTHYVTEDSALDEEASDRGTSIYLADRVIPMLPEELSNGICSLNPQVDRLTLTCEIEIDANGNTVKHDIYPSVIKSKYRLTYQQVNKYYRQEFSWDNSQLHKMLDDALALSKIMRKYKEKEGYIDFEITESKIIIDEKGKTKDIVPRERLESEMMIEDFMVRANETVAKHTEDANLAFIYRVHDKPDLDRVANLQGVVQALGMDVKIPQSPNPKEFAKAINQIKVSRFDDFMKIMFLRTMAKAEYSPNNIGHFGLSSPSYSHFTSPIRRYPDLIAHRMLREYFFKKNSRLSSHFAQILPEIAAHSSTTEQKAMELERKVADIKKAEFYEKFVGQTFEGTIVSMLKFGFFVEFPNKVDGLVHLSTLVDGDYKLTSDGYGLTNGKNKFMIGDKVKVVVVGATKNEGKIDLVLASLFANWKEQQQKMMKNHRHSGV